MISRVTPRRALGRLLGLTAAAAVVAGAALAPAPFPARGAAAAAATAAAATAAPTVPYETVGPGALAGRAKAIVNKPISVTDEYAGAAADFTADEKAAGFVPAGVLKLRLKNSSMPALWARSPAAEKEFAALTTGAAITVYGKIRQIKGKDGALRFYFVADSVVRGSPTGAAIKPTAAVGGGFEAARALAPKSMPFVAARRLAMQPEEFDGAYVSTEARFHAAAANLGEGPDAAEFPSATTLRVSVTELPFPIFLEKKADWVGRLVDLEAGTPIAVWGRLVSRPGKTYALVALHFDVPSGRTKPKTK